MRCTFCRDHDLAKRRVMIQDFEIEALQCPNCEFWVVESEAGTANLENLTEEHFNDLIQEKERASLRLEKAQQELNEINRKLGIHKPAQSDGTA